ncbi:MAG: hypothetical protein FJ000_02060 [Actinobacteria bacterium]|nr:hypothetical protein [Actinomycetota bacterium]
MRRSIVVVVALAALGLMAVAITACGAASEADRKLDEAMGEYRSALDEVQRLDLREATQGEIDAVRQRLADRWQDVRQRADDAGREVDAKLQDAQAQVDEALDKAGEGVGAGLEEAGRALDTAVDQAGAALKDAWSAIKDLF